MNNPLHDLLGPFNPEACERQTVREANARAPKCDQGHATTYSHAVGAYRCEFGALIRTSGKLVRACGR